MPKKSAARKTVTAKTTGSKLKAKPGTLTLSSSTVDTDFTAAFDGLKRVMTAFAPELLVTADEPQKYYMVTKSNSRKGGPMFFGTVLMGKAYISYHLMALYSCPELARKISPELKKRMQGNSCFNFRTTDAPLFAELGELTCAGLEKYRLKGWF